MPRIGGVGAVQAAHVGRAGPVGHGHVLARLVAADPFDLGPLKQPELRRPVQPHVEPVVTAEHDRRGPAQDHARVGTGHPADAFLAVGAQGVVMTEGRRRRLGRPGRHRLGEGGEQPVNRREVGLLRHHPLEAGLRSFDLA